jgi:hypothetical protein
VGQSRVVSADELANQDAVPHIPLGRIGVWPPYRTTVTNSWISFRPSNLDASDRNLCHKPFQGSSPISSCGRDVS